jgi:hypothetical protein
MTTTATATNANDEPWMEFMTPIPSPDPELSRSWKALFEKPKKKKRVLTEEDIKMVLSSVCEEKDHDGHQPSNAP